MRLSLQVYIYMHSVFPVHLPPLLVYASIRTMSSVPSDQSSCTYCAVEFFLALKFFTIEVQRHSQIPDDTRLVVSEAPASYCIVQ